jgi:diacylglycerol kinase family enzyme
VIELEALFAEGGITLVRVWCSDSDELAQAFKEVEKRDLDVLVVLGGDGTIRSAAELCTSDGPLLIPLPGGTMNILPKALYGDASWQDILRNVIANPRAKQVSGGTVGGKRFYISAICGAPALWAHAREALREGSVQGIIEHSKAALDQMFASKVHYRFNEMHEGDAEALTVTCPLISSSLEEDRQVFEAAIIDVNDAGEVLSLATAAAFGSWRDTKHVAIVQTAQVTLSSSEGALPMLLDGEPVEVGSEADVTFIPHAFTALIGS